MEHDVFFAGRELRPWQLNRYLSTNANRRDFFLNEPDFKKLDPKNCTKTLDDFYHHAVDHIEEISEDARCNLLCHKKNPYQKETLEKLIDQNLLQESAWAQLSKEGFLADILKKYASPKALTLFLTHHEFKNVSELNEWMHNATFLDFRLGRSDTETSIREYIEFLNTLSSKNRLIFLKSNHPLNKNVWQQVPKLEKFTVADYKKLTRTTEEQEVYDIEARKKQARLRRQRALEASNVLFTVIDAPLETRSREAIEEDENERLDHYLARNNIILTHEEFNKMRGEALSADDFIRLHCEDFSFEDFEYFIKPFVKANDKINMNRVLACFLSFFIQHPKLLLDKHHGIEKRKRFIGTTYRTGKSALLEALGTSSAKETYNNIITLAGSMEESEVQKNIARANNLQEIHRRTDVAVLTEVDPTTGERKHLRSYNLKGDFIITDSGSAFTSGLPAQSFENLVGSANNMAKQNAFNKAAEEYCIALSIRLDLTLLTTTFNFIAQHHIKKYYGVIVSRILDHLNDLYAQQDAASLANIHAWLTCIADLEKQDKTLLETFKRKTTAEKTVPLINHREQYDNFFNALKRITDLDLSGNKSQKILLLQLWIEAYSSFSQAQKLEALFFCLQYSPEPNDLQKIARYFKQWVVSAENVESFSVETLKKIFLLELSTTAPGELESLLHTVIPLTETTQRKKLLLLQNITIDTVDIEKDYFTSEINRLFPGKTIPGFDTLLTSIVIEQLEVNNEAAMRRVYDDYQKLAATPHGYNLRGNTDNEKNIIREILKKTKNPIVKFVLSGEEEKMRQRLLKNEGTFPSQVTEKQNECYQPLLKEMVEQGNIRAVSRLANMGVNLDSTFTTKQGKEYPVLQVLFTKINHDNQSTPVDTELYSLIQKIPEESRERLFKNIASELFYNTKPFSVGLYLTLLNSCKPTSKVTFGNFLLAQLIHHGSYDLAKELIETKTIHFNLYPLIKVLNNCIKHRSETHIAYFLSMIDDLLSQKTIFTVEEKLHLTEVLSFLLCEKNRNRYKKSLISIFTKCAKALPESIFEPESNAFYDNAANVFLTAYNDQLLSHFTGNLPERRNMQSSKEWLITVFKHALLKKSHPQLFARDSKNRTFKTLERLDWIQENVYGLRQITSFSPILKLPTSQQQSHLNPSSLWHQQRDAHLLQTQLETTHIPTRTITRPREEPTADDANDTIRVQWH